MTSEPSALPPVTLAEAAQAYAAAGWSVFPAWETGDRAKAPRVRWKSAATTDPATLETWWEQWPAALIALPVPPGMVVLDIDPRHGGSLDALHKAVGPLPDTLTSYSGRGDGGRHLWFRLPDGATVPQSSPCPGVDVRAGGRGYLIAPPSPHPDTGQPYTWESAAPYWPALLPATAVAALNPHMPRQGPCQPRSGPNRPRPGRVAAQAR